MPLFKLFPKYNVDPLSAQIARPRAETAQLIRQAKQVGVSCIGIYAVVRLRLSNPHHADSPPLKQKTATLHSTIPGVHESLGMLGGCLVKSRDERFIFTQWQPSEGGWGVTEGVQSFPALLAQIAS